MGPKRVEKAFFAAACLALAVFAGFLDHILRPMVSVPWRFGSEDLRAASQAMPVTLLGQLRVSLDDYLWLKTDDYLSFGMSEYYYKDVKTEKGMMDDFLANVDPSAKRSRSDSHLSGTNDWRGIFGKLEYFHPIKAHHGDPKELLPWYRTQTTLNPTDVAAYLNGAFFLADFARKPEEALVFLTEGIKNNPDSLELHQAIGRLYYDKWKNCDAAIPYLERAIELGRTIQSRSEVEKKALGDAYLFLARAYREKGDLDAALCVAEKGMVECPDHALVRVIHRIVTKELTARPGRMENNGRNPPY